MDEGGTTDLAWQERLVGAVERVAVANEQLIELATTERDSGDSAFGPAFCPHCGTFNPSVRNEGGIGQMAEFVLLATCQACHKTFFAFPQGWICLASEDEAREEMERRK